MKTLAELKDMPSAELDRLAAEAADVKMRLAPEFGWEQMALKDPAGNLSMIRFPSRDLNEAAAFESVVIGKVGGDAYCSALRRVIHESDPLCSEVLDMVLASAKQRVIAGLMALGVE